MLDLMHMGLSTPADLHSPQTLPCLWPYTCTETHHQLPEWNQAPGYCWWPDDTMAEVRERNCHQMYSFRGALYYGDESADQRCPARDIKDQRHIQISISHLAEASWMISLWQQHMSKLDGCWQPWQTSLKEEGWSSRQLNPSLSSIH